MPRSVNNVASRAKRKRVMELAKGYFGRRKNVWTVAKNAVEKVRREISAPYGLPVLMQASGYMVYLTLSSWVKSKRQASI